MSIIEDTNEGLDWNPQKDKVEDYILVTYSFRSDLDPKEAAESYDKFFQLMWNTAIK
jgi:hypothetical protein